jgi:hypothetical protein
MGVYLIGVHLMGMHLMGVHLIYESSLRAGYGWREMFKASGCGRLGRQAADHPWSTLRVVKSCPKRLPDGKVLLEAKAAALHPNRYQSSPSKPSKTRLEERDGVGKRNYSY